VLDIGYNKIESLSCSLFSLIKLEILLIHCNPFSYLSVNIYKLSNLSIFAIDWFKYTFPSINPLINIQ
jgi:hypothetical protein